MYINTYEWILTYNTYRYIYIYLHKYMYTKIYILTKYIYLHIYIYIHTTHTYIYIYIYLSTRIRVLWTSKEGLGMLWSYQAFTKFLIIVTKLMSSKQSEGIKRFLMTLLTSTHWDQHISDILDWQL